MMYNESSEPCFLALRLACWFRCWNSQNLRQPKQLESFYFSRILTDREQEQQQQEQNQAEDFKPVPRLKN